MIPTDAKNIDEQQGDRKCPIQFSLGADKDLTVIIQPHPNAPTMGFSKLDELHKHMQDMTGTHNTLIAQHIIGETVDVLAPVCPDGEAYNLVSQAFSESKPNDLIEARLISQMTALYSEGMRYLGRAGKEKTLCHFEAYQKCAIKLLRLHSETVEALTRYRRKGEQKVIVQHVNVNQGGQAVVGGIVSGGGVNEKK